MLEQFQFEDEADRIQAEVGAMRFDDRRPANVRADDFFGGGDLGSIDGCVRHDFQFLANPVVSKLRDHVLLYLGSWLIVYMNLERALEALSSSRRLQVLEWLRHPRKHFPPQVYGDLVKDGVCGVFIARKLGVSQPTASEHLKILVQAGLVRAKRIKQWTFYKRDEAHIKRLKKTIVASV